MKPRTDNRNIFLYFSFSLCLLLSLGMIFLQWEKLDSFQEYEIILRTHSSLFMILSGVLAILLLVILIGLGLYLKTKKTETVRYLEITTQKMHHFRSIAELLYRSNIWPKGLMEYIDKEYPNLSFFEIKEFHKGRSKNAIDFLQETHHYGGTEMLFLELKSLLMAHPKEKYIPEVITYPSIYSPEIVRKWTEHKIGTGLHHVFSYKYGTFKEFLDLQAVFKRHQEKILSLAYTMDPEEFEGSSFDHHFFSKLWEYMNKEIIPKLAQSEGVLEQRMSAFMKYLYTCFSVFVFFGILLPLSYMVLSLEPLALIISFSVVISTLLYVVLTFYTFLSGEMNPAYKMS